MSGERIALAGDVDGAAERLVRTTAQLAGLDLGRYALVGGLAVMCRLAAVHRATQDVDTVTEATVPTAIEVITSQTNGTRLRVRRLGVESLQTRQFPQAIGFVTERRRDADLSWQAVGNRDGSLQERTAQRGSGGFRLDSLSA